MTVDTCVECKRRLDTPGCAQTPFGRSHIARKRDQHRHDDTCRRALWMDVATIGFFVATMAVMFWAAWSW